MILCASQLIDVIILVYLPRVAAEVGLNCHHNGRHQEEDAGHEGREGQCHGQV